jgi:TonB family protein
MRVIPIALSLLLLSVYGASQEAVTAPKCTADQTRDCVIEPRLKKQVKAKYTKKAEKAGIEGTVVLLCTVGIDGRAHDIKVAHSLGGDLDESAMKALSKWKFEPATLNGKPVPYQISIETNFFMPSS